MRNRGWNPKKWIGDIILAEVVAASGALRFRDLWAKCQGRMSRQSLVEGLSELERSGFIVRTALARKHVEYHPNTKIPEIRDLLEQARSWTSEMDGRRRNLEALTRQWSDWLSKGRNNARLRKELVRALIHGYCYLIAYEATKISMDLAAFKAKVGNHPIVESIYEPRIRAIIDQRRRISEVFRVDERLAKDVLREWFAESLGRSKTEEPLLRLLSYLDKHPPEFRNPQ